MGALRWILLLAGLVFLAALTLWELRRPRQGRGGPAAPPPQRSEPSLGAMDEEDTPVRVSSSASPAPGGARLGQGRRPLAPPVQIDLPPQRAPAAQNDALQPQSGDDAAAPVELEVLPLYDYEAPAEPGAERLAAEPPAPEPILAGLPESKLVVDWPPDGQRHIVALRIVPGNEERLSGRAVRLAINACGFIHGRFGIYHQPGLDGRSLLSVASLSKPGILDPDNLDFQRLAGINMFTVLPGPLPPAAALDHLVETARDLAQRLEARLQDERGQTLDAERLESLRGSVRSLDAEPAA
jgi:FtsZ-interacting cell division protein ZipA